MVDDETVDDIHFPSYAAVSLTTAAIHPENYSTSYLNTTLAARLLDFSSTSTFEYATSLTTHYLITDISPTPVNSTTAAVSATNSASTPETINTNTTLSYSPIIPTPSNTSINSDSTKMAPSISSTLSTAALEPQRPVTFDWNSFTGPYSSTSSRYSTTTTSARPILTPFPHRPTYAYFANYYRFDSPTVRHSRRPD